MYNIRTMNENILPTMTDEERNEFLEIINTDVEKPMALLDGFEDCLLYYMEEQSVAELAELLSIPQGTVKSRLHKARQLLEKELEDYYS